MSAAVGRGRGRCAVRPAHAGPAARHAADGLRGADRGRCDHPGRRGGRCRQGRAPAHRGPGRAARTSRTAKRGCMRRRPQRWPRLERLGEATAAGARPGRPDAGRARTAQSGPAHRRQRQHGQPDAADPGRRGPRRPRPPARARGSATSIAGRPWSAGSARRWPSCRWPRRSATWRAAGLPDSGRPPRRTLHGGRAGRCATRGQPSRPLERCRGRRRGLGTGAARTRCQTDIEARRPIQGRGCRCCPRSTRPRWAGSARDWYLGPHREALFDTAGNAGPTIWSDGRIVGGWAVLPSGEVVTRLLEDIGSEAARRRLSRG